MADTCRAIARKLVITGSYSTVEIKPNSTYANLCAILREAISVVIVLIVCRLKLNYCELLSCVLVYGMSVQLVGGVKVCRQYSQASTKGCLSTIATRFCLGGQSRHSLFF